MGGKREYEGGEREIFGGSSLSVAAPSSRFEIECFHRAGVKSNL